MDLANVNVSPLMLQRLAELKADDHAESKRKLEAIEAAMTPQWRQSMHERINSLSRQASAPRSKLPKLYLLMEEVGELRSEHVSCKAGCSACCRTIPVEISDLEARHIAAATGKQMANLPPGRHTRLQDVSTPCPFLLENQCSIYEHRPYNCRSLAAVDRDALSCSDENTALTRAKDPRAVPVVMTKMQAFDPLYREIIGRKPVAWADIRQFFPTKAQAGDSLNTATASTN
jgi:Fe-S-cluster containining protein